MIYKITLPNIKYGHLMPEEDSLAHDNGIFAVADGITRDPIENTDFTDKKIEDILKSYPNPSGAKIAADTFCSEFIKSIKTDFDVKKAFIKSNNAIDKLNKKNIKEVDYLVNDFWACVASGGFIKNNILNWGVIGDCGVKIFDAKGKIKFQSPNSVEIFEKYVKMGKINFKWDRPEGRKFVRQQYRNRPDQIIDGIRVSYGALTGEVSATPFIYTGAIQLSVGDCVIFYSDGFEKIFKRKDFFDKISDQLDDPLKKIIQSFSEELARKNYEDYGRERTLIAFRANLK